MDFDNFKVGDKFKFKGYSTIYEITKIKDYGLKICFRALTGQRKGSVGYTELPQDLIKVINYDSEGMI